MKVSTIVLLGIVLLPLAKVLGVVEIGAIETLIYTVLLCVVRAGILEAEEENERS